MIEYWPRDEFSCDQLTKRISADGTNHLHCGSDEEIVRAWNYALACARRTKPYLELPTTLIGPPFGMRYFCITGPGGSVRSVR